jgi:hypothetical protein
VEPGEALGLAAQVAVTPAGFAGVVVVFRPASVHQWSSLDRFRLRLLLSNSILPLAYSIIAIFLLTIKPPPESIWRLCSGVAVVCQVPFAITNFTVQSPAQLFHMTTHRSCVCELLTDNWCASFPLASEGSASEG